MNKLPRLLPYYSNIMVTTADAEGKHLHLHLLLGTVIKRNCTCTCLQYWARFKVIISLVKAVADPGGAAGARPPYRSRFFCFDIQIFRNVAASGVGAPPPRGRRPPTEILDPLLEGQTVRQRARVFLTEDITHLISLDWAFYTKMLFS